MSMWNRSSASSSRSSRLRRNSDVSRVVILRSMIMSPGSAGSVGEDSPDRVGKPLPVPGFFGQLFSAALRQLVVLRLPVVLGIAPFRFDQSLLLEAMESGIERPLVDLEHVARDLLDA